MDGIQLELKKCIWIPVLRVQISHVGPYVQDIYEVTIWTFKAGNAKLPASWCGIGKGID